MTNDMLRFENNGKPRLAVFIVGDRLSDEQAEAVKEWIDARPDTYGHIELQASQVRGVSPAGIAALLDEHFRT